MVGANILEVVSLFLCVIVLMIALVDVGFVLVTRKPLNNLAWSRARLGVITVGGLAFLGIDLARGSSPQYRLAFFALGLVCLGAGAVIYVWRRRHENPARVGFAKNRTP